MKALFVLIYIFGLGSISHTQTAASKTLYLWTSGDGTNFTNETFFIDSCDVPSIALDSTGQIIAAFQSFKGGIPEWDKIGLRFSNDNGATWTSRQSANITGFPGTSNRAFDPTITVDSSGLYRLYFTYCPNTMQLDSTCDTYSATSIEGLNYTFDAGVRMDVDNKEVIDPAVTYFNNQWHYCNPIGAPPNEARYAKSANGLNFSVTDTIGQLGPGTNWTGNLMNNGATMRFYGGSDNAHNNTIWWNETTDGITWSGYNWTNVQGNSSKDPGICKLNNGQFLMIVSKDSSAILNTTGILTNLTAQTYPNPVQDKFTINSESPLNFLLFDMNGTLLLKRNQVTNETFDLSKLNSGVYVFHLTNDKEIQQIKKLIKL